MCGLNILATTYKNALTATASYLVNNDQAVSEISDALGLGMELYINMKKVDMLQNPSLYLQQRNKALQDRAANTQKIYGDALRNVVKTVAGTDNKKDPAYKVTSAAILAVMSRASDLTQSSL